MLAILFALAFVPLVGAPAPTAVGLWRTPVDEGLIRIRPAARRSAAMSPAPRA